jgi:hypothetical protein
MFNLFEIYRNHIRYKEIEKYANDFLIDLDRRIEHCEINSIGETDLDYLSLNKFRIKSYYASKRDLIFIMGSSFSYPTIWTHWCLNYKNYDKKEKNV